MPLIIFDAEYIAKFRISLLAIWAFLVIFINNSTRHAIPFFGSGPRRVFLFLGGVGDAGFIAGQLLPFLWLRALF